MSEIIDGKHTDWKKDVNCHAYCPYGKMCRYCKGDTGPCGFNRCWARATP